MSPQLIQGNRAPVMTRWAAVVAERLGHAPDAALTLGKAVAGLNAHAKGRRLGLYEAPPDQAEAPASPRRPTGGQRLVPMRGRAVPAVQTSHGVRATSNGQPIDPGRGRRALKRAVGGERDAVRAALEELAQADSRDALAARAYPLYEPCRPAVPAGTQGWGATGELRLDARRALVSKGQGSGWPSARVAERGRRRRSPHRRGRATAQALASVPGCGGGGPWRTGGVRLRQLVHNRARGRGGAIPRLGSSRPGCRGGCPSAATPQRARPGRLTSPLALEQVEIARRVVVGVRF